MCPFGGSPIEDLDSVLTLKGNWRRRENDPLMVVRLRASRYGATAFA
jgi:hypothetical protein